LDWLVLQLLNLLVERVLLAAEQLQRSFLWVLLEEAHSALLAAPLHELASSGGEHVLLLQLAAAAGC
jgi:hypothetical protein